MVFEKILDFIKKFFSNKKRNIILIILAALLLLDLVMGLFSRIIISKMPEQLGADRWDYDGSVAQVSLFYTEDREITPGEIRKLEYNFEKKLVEAGIIAVDDDEKEADKKEIVDTNVPGKKKTDDEKSQEVQEEVKVYNSCFSAQGISTILFENRTAENIVTIGVDGDFFFFHPLELVSGSYFSDDEVMKDKIVIDEDLAWQLFGSNDIVGQCVTIGGVNHYVAGVVKRQEGRMNEAAGLSESIVYMSYDSLSRYGEILSGKTSNAEISEDGSTANIGGINCYEVVAPNPVDGLVAQSIKLSSGYDDKYINVVDNTDRFSFFKLLDVSTSFGKRSMWDKPIFYPYWENVARGYEDVLALLNMIRLICKIACVLIVCVMAVHAYRHKTWTIEGLIEYAADKKYELETRQKAKLSDKKQDNL
ncbi:ABC transporter permease [Butyrivibrio sp. VCB2006]|uniref:ABC transporter permease n=1 Tax=Butyrivibrio sp. VCB2006 TaxID=1280679 RepID=UPI0003FD6144|nr:ABC transporter permease [Butyrivibrio sp. VCB2006]